MTATEFLRGLLLARLRDADETERAFIDGLLHGEWDPSAACSALGTRPLQLLSADGAPAPNEYPGKLQEK